VLQGDSEKSVQEATSVCLLAPQTNTANKWKPTS
jgi:hypothetical protein